MVEKIKQTHADVRFSTPLDSLELLTDSARLQQVLINLLINATKFTAQGTITLELVKQTEDTALFSVSDTGCGISKENQNKIFNRFEKLDENAQGTGLGLSICQLIIEQLGGKIWIDPDSFQMSISELAVAVQSNINVKIIIMQNGRLGMVREIQDKLYGSRYAATILNDSPDFAKLAEAYGIKAYVATTNKEAENAVAEMLESDKPNVLICQVSPETPSR